MALRVTQELDAHVSVEHLDPYDGPSWHGLRVIKRVKGEGAPSTVIKLSDGDTVATIVLDDDDTALLRDELLPQRRA